MSLTRKGATREKVKSSVRSPEGERTTSVGTRQAPLQQEEAPPTIRKHRNPRPCKDLQEAHGQDSRRILSIGPGARVDAG